MDKTPEPFRVMISIHALREERDLVLSLASSISIKISIHALREERDLSTCGVSAHRL